MDEQKSNAIVGLFAALALLALCIVFAGAALAGGAM